MNFRIEIFAKVRGGQKGEFGARCPELVLLTVPNNLEYLYTKIRFSTPGSAPSCKSADTWCRSCGQPRTHACTQQQQYVAAAACMPVHACRSMHAGSCMPVHACRFMPAASKLLLMRACAWRAYCKKCRVNLGSKRSGWPNVPVLIQLCVHTAVTLKYHDPPRGLRTRPYFRTLIPGFNEGRVLLNDRIFQTFV